MPRVSFPCETNMVGSRSFHVTFFLCPPFNLSNLTPFLDSSIFFRLCGSNPFVTFTSVTMFGSPWFSDIHDPTFSQIIAVINDVDNEADQDIAIRAEKKTGDKLLESIRVDEMEFSRKYMEGEGTAAPADGYEKCPFCNHRIYVCNSNGIIHIKIVLSF